MKNFFIFFLTLLLLGHIYLLFHHYQEYRTFQEAESWQATSAKIIHSNVTKQSSYNPDWRVWRHTFYLDLEYEYEIGDHHYTSKQINFAQRASYSEDRVPNAYIKRYPLDQSITVYVNPGNPSEAVIDKYYDKDNVILIFISMLVILASLYYFARHFEA